MSHKHPIDSAVGYFLAEARYTSFSSQSSVTSMLLKQLHWTGLCQVVLGFVVCFPYLSFG